MITFTLPATPVFKLPPETIHVWRASLDIGDAEYDQHFDLLDENEKWRAKRFVFEHHKRHFVAGRSTLRQILGRYLNIDPKDLQFTYGKHGKPTVLSEQADPFHFNMSHSQAIALYAVGGPLSLGVDVEVIRPSVDSLGIAKRFFTAREWQTLERLTEPHKTQAFYNAWTRKEAFLKALGQGLTYPLHHVDVSLLPEERAELLAIEGSIEKAREWSLHNLEVGDDYRAALVVEGTPQAVHGWEFLA
ncbi:MAG: 4'-phosphopantetheinyl transferase superfamily protein [Pseudomonadota bacterium]